MQTFAGRTANELWLRAAESVLEEGREQDSRAGRTRELLHTVLVLEDPRQRWVTWREPALNPAFAITEVVWIVSGRRDAGFVNFWNPGLWKYAGEGNNYHGAYGFRLRHNFEVDQVERAYLALKGNPESRQVILQIWDPKLDFPTDAGQPQAADIPCNLCSLLKLRDGKLDWTQIMRSNDILLGLPHNLIQFTTLQELMACWLGVEVGVYTHLSDSLHAYEQDLESLRDLVGGEDPENNEKWVADYAQTASIFAELASRMDGLRDVAMSRDAFLKLADEKGLNGPSSNYLRVAAADAARRRGWEDLAEAAMMECRNPALVCGWERWCKRQAD